MISSWVSEKLVVPILLGLQVLLTGAKQLVEHDASVAHMGHLERLYVIVVMGTAIVTKLALFLYCRTFDNEIVRAYAQVLALTCMCVDTV